MSAFFEVINPFAELNESKLHPHARSLRTTFWQKIRDTFFVFHGSFGFIDEEKKNIPGKFHIGMIDLPTFGLSYLLNLIAMQTLASSKTPFWIKIPLGVLTVTCFILPRMILSAASTLVSVPFVGLAQFITSFVSSRLKHEIKTYETTANIHGQETTFPIYSLLRAHDAELEDIDSIEYKKVHPQKQEPGQIELSIRAGTKLSYRVNLPIDAKGQLIKEKDQRFFNALRELNVGNIDQKVEEADVAILRSAT